LSEEAKAVWVNQGAEFSSFSPQQFGQFVSAEIKRWAQVVRVSGAKLD
jgi:tripartite-type tricarboxylate transporter receptor subunit TctC